MLSHRAREQSPDRVGAVHPAPPPTTELVGPRIRVLECVTLTTGSASDAEFERPEVTCFTAANNPQIRLGFEVFCGPQPFRHQPGSEVRCGGTLREADPERRDPKRKKREI